MNIVKAEIYSNIYCYNDKNEKHKVKKCKIWLINDRETRSEIEGFICDKCDRYYVSSKKFKYLKNKFHKYNFKESIEESYIIKDNLKLSSTSFIEKITTVLKAANKHKEHILTDIYGVIPVLNHDNEIINIETPALYCNSCDRLFILESDFKKLESEGIILCQIITEDYWQKQIDNKMYHLNSESILHKVGYNVSDKENLSQEERRNILKNIIESGLLTRSQVSSHLDYLIRRSKGQKRLQRAIEKWTSDRKFISELKLNLNSVEITKLKVRRKNV